MGKLLEKDWRFPNEDSLDRITDALLWELSRTVYNESSSLGKVLMAREAWPMSVKQWPNGVLLYKKAKACGVFILNVFGVSKAWTIRKPDVLARLISNLRAKPPLNEDKTIVGVVGESPSLAMSEVPGYGAIKMYVDLRSPTPELIKDFDKMVKQERLKHMPDICDRFGNLKKARVWLSHQTGLPNWSRVHPCYLTLWGFIVFTKILRNQLLVPLTSCRRIISNS